MRYLKINLVILLIASTCILGMCSKKDEQAQPPIAIKLSKGILVTQAPNSIGKLDSVCFRNSTTGSSYTLNDYSHTAEAGGFIKRPKDVWELTNTGNNTWHLKNGGGRYLGIGDKIPNILEVRYNISLDEVPGEKNLFVMNESDGKFYIQPVSNKNVYLNSLPDDGVSSHPRHTKVLFVEGEKQMWFFMP